ncbi:cytochrome b561 [Buttiauxella sp. A111]|nr:cytochrome b561 [Buttiauxella sp. A111]
MLIMVTSGWRIYNASPLFDAMFPDNLTLGGWLGGAIQWHFAGMWLFGINGVVYLLINIFSGRLKRKFFPLTIQGIFADFKDALRGKLAHADLSQYNMVQKLAYLFVMCDGVLLVVSGLVVWKSVQFPLLNTLMGGFDAARYVHFFAMSAMVGFVVIHLIMVMLVPKTLLTMLRGR